MEQLGASFSPDTPTQSDGSLMFQNHFQRQNLLLQNLLYCLVSNFLVSMKAVNQLVKQCDALRDLLVDYGESDDHLIMSNITLNRSSANLTLQVTASNI